MCVLYCTLRPVIISVWRRPGCVLYCTLRPVTALYCTLRPVIQNLRSGLSSSLAPTTCRSFCVSSSERPPPALVNLNSTFTLLETNGMLRIIKLHSPSPPPPHLSSTLWWSILLQCHTPSSHSAMHRFHLFNWHQRMRWLLMAGPSCILPFLPWYLVQLMLPPPPPPPPINLLPSDFFHPFLVFSFPCSATSPAINTPLFKVSSPLILSI